MRLTKILNKLPSPRKPALVLLVSLGISTLYGCIKPVDYDAFFEDQNVINIIHNTKIGKLVVSDVEFGIEDLCPQLSINDKPLQEEETITLRKSPAPETATITVTNAESFTKIDWYCIDTTPLTLGVSEDGAKFTASTANEPFKNAKKYMVTVVGIAKEDSKAYGIFFNIKVES